MGVEDNVRGVNTACDFDDLASELMTEEGGKVEKKRCEELVGISCKMVAL